MTLTFCAHDLIDTILLSLTISVFVVHPVYRIDLINVFTSPVSSMNSRLKETQTEKGTK
jgi:hypothetical protein